MQSPGRENSWACPCHVKSTHERESRAGKGRKFTKASRQGQTQKIPFSKETGLKLQGKIKTHPMWTSQWWNLLLENRTLYSVSPVCLWWTISLQGPTGSILFVIILWHPDTTQVWPRGVINKRQSPQVWTTGLNSPRSDFCRRIGQIETLVSPKFVQWSSFTWQHCKNRSLWGEICIVFLVHGDNANKSWPRKSLFWQETSVNWHIHKTTYFHIY